MSKDLQKMMASKYPSQPIMNDSAPTGHVGEQTKICILTPKKMLYITLLFAVLFFFLALPQTFKSVGSFFPNLNSGSTVDPKLVALHALVFALVAFFIFRMC